MPQQKATRHKGNKATRNAALLYASMPQQATRHKGNKATRNAALLYASMPQQKATRQQDNEKCRITLCLCASAGNKA
jgi:hypothetical protein